MIISKDFDAILADYDGTVLDSMPHLAINAVELFRSEGVEIDPDEYIREYTQPFINLYKHFGVRCDTPEDLKRVYDKYWEISDRNNFVSDFFPNVLEAFKSLRAEGLQLGIVSAAKRSAILDRLNHEGVGNLFDEKHVVGESDQKTHAIREFYTINKINPQRVLMIGDVPSDLKYGREAGVKVAGFVYKGYPEKISLRLIERLEEVNPDLIFSDWKDLK